MAKSFRRQMLLSLATGVLAGCNQSPPPRKSTMHLVRRVAVEAAPTPTPVPTKLPGVPVAPKSLNFVQKGLHNCGTVAMLLSWARLHPREAARLVRRQSDGSYTVHFAGDNTATVTAVQLKEARKVQLVQCANDDRWAEIVLTAFAKFVPARYAPTDNGPRPALDFSNIEWISPTELGEMLSGERFKAFAIKPERVDAKRRLQVGPPVATELLDRELRSMRNRPAAALTNRRVHIWAVLDYDAARKRVYARNPRRAQGVWMSLAEFREKFQLVVYGEGRGHV